MLTPATRETFAPSRKQEQAMITTELAPPAEAMTAADIKRHIKAIAAVVGPQVIASASVSINKYEQHECSIALYLDDYYRGGEYFRADTWSEAIAAAYEWASTRSAIWRDTMIRKLALAIIDLTDQHGECTERLLLTRDFTSATVREFHEAACARANEMAGGAPFRVVLL
jgi:hypothetical protein